MVEGDRRRRPYKKLRRSRHHYPLNPGRGAAHPAAPFRLAALATHPREGGGQVTWRRGTLPSNPAYPILWGKGDHALQTCLPPLVGGRGTTKWWRGAAEGGIIKLRRSRHHHLQRRRRCRPLSEANHNPSTQPAAPAAPLFKFAAKPPPSPSARRAVKP